MVNLIERYQRILRYAAIPRLNELQSVEWVFTHSDISEVLLLLYGEVFDVTSLAVKHPDGDMTWPRVLEDWLNDEFD